MSGVRIEKRLEPVQGFNVGPFGAAFELWDVWSGAKRLYSGSDGEKAKRIADKERRRLKREAGGAK